MSWTVTFSMRGFYWDSPKKFRRIISALLDKKTKEGGGKWWFK